MAPLAPHTAKADPSFLRWVRPPQQERTREQLERILEAAETLLAEQEFSRVSVVRIASAARTSVGGFYRRFPTKSALLHALHERFCEQAKATASLALDPTRWQGIPTPVMFQSLVDFLIDVYSQRRGLFRAFLLQAISDVKTNRRNRDLFDHLTAKMAALLQERRNDLDHTDPWLGAGFVLRVMFGTLNHFLVVPEEGRLFSESVVRRELARAFRTYLGLRAPHVAAAKVP